jgi:hypothetical protein
MDREYGTYGKDYKHVYKEYLNRRRPLGRPTHRCKSNIKVYLKVCSYGLDLSD